VKIKILNEKAKMPCRAHPNDAGADLFAIEDCIIMPGERKIIPTGISIKLPESLGGGGYYARIAPRSGLAAKNGIDVLAGVVDSNYTGELKVVLLNTGENAFEVKSGDRIAQLIIEKHYNFEFEVVDSLEETSRGAGGFGSTG
jgi:dUTP pyrophosphatase